MPFLFLSFWNYAVFLCLLGFSVDLEIGKLTLEVSGKERFDLAKKLSPVMTRASVCPFLIENIAQMRTVLEEIGKRSGKDDWTAKEQMMVEGKLGLERGILPHLGKSAVPYICQTYFAINPTTQDPIELGLKSVLWNILNEISEGCRLHYPPWENEQVKKWLNENFAGSAPDAIIPTEEFCKFISEKMSLPSEAIMRLFGKTTFPGNR